MNCVLSLFATLSGNVKQVTPYCCITGHKLIRLTVATIQSYWLLVGVLYNRTVTHFRLYNSCLRLLPSGDSTHDANE